MRVASQQDLVELASGRQSYQMPRYPAMQAAGNSLLASQLQRKFSDQLPTYDSFKDSFKEAYTHQAVRGMYRPGVGVIDGVVRQLSEQAGYSDPKQITRLKNESPYVKEMLDAVSLQSSRRLEDVERNSGFVRGLLDYRSAVGEYIASDPFQQRLDNVVNSFSNPYASPAGAQGLKSVESEWKSIATELSNRDVVAQIKGAPLQAQLYASVDRAVSLGLGIKDAFNEARKDYLSLAAYKAGFDERAIKDILGKQESSTTVPRIFERAGLDFEQMKQSFMIYDALRQKYIEQESVNAKHKEQEVQTDEQTGNNGNIKFRKNSIQGRKGTTREQTKLSDRKIVGEKSMNSRDADSSSGMGDIDRAVIEEIMKRMAGNRKAA
jgi:hypothetical protein